MPPGRNGALGSAACAFCCAGLVPRRVVGAGGQLEAAELGPGGGVVLLDREQAQQRADGLGGVAVRLVRGGEVAVSLRGIRLDLVLGLGDRAAPAAAEDAVVELIQAAAVAGADPEADEAEREDDREHHVQPLLVAPQADEEELLIRVAAAAVPAPSARARLRRLRLRRRLLLRLDRCPCHQPPRVAEAGAIFPLRRSRRTASQIDASNRSHIGSSSRNVVRKSGPGRASATAAVMK